MQVLSQLFLIVFIFVACTSLKASQSFRDKSAIYWRIEITNDEKSTVVEESKINSINQIKNDSLNITCERPLLTKEHFKFNSTTNKGYTRDEERSKLECLFKGAKLTSKNVLCAKGYAKNSVGNIYSDSSEINIEHGDSKLQIKLSCTLK